MRDAGKDKERNNKIATLVSKNMPAIIRELIALWHELTTMVIFGPTDFQMDDYKGNMNSWQDFGKFVYALKQGRDILPENIKQKVQNSKRDSVITKKDCILRIHAEKYMVYQYPVRNRRLATFSCKICSRKSLW